MNNERILPHVCGKCKDLILPPFEDLHDFTDMRYVDIVEVCRKCKDGGAK